MEQPVVEVKGLNKKIGRHHILKDVSFSIYPKEIVGFIGPNGAGKSTTMKCICNLLFPTSGTIRVCGYDVVKERDKALAQQASLIEHPGLYPGMSGMENLKLAAAMRKIGKERVLEIAQFTGLKEHLHKQTARYSMGMKQRLALGIVLLGKPKFIILDEPTNGLDPKGIMELREILKELVEKEEISILFSSHALGEIEKVANRIICINNGKIIDTPKELTYSFSYRLSTSDDIRVQKKFMSDPEVLECRLEREELFVSFQGKDVLRKQLAELCSMGIAIHDITREELDIEMIYQKIYGD